MCHVSKPMLHMSGPYHPEIACVGLQSFWTLKLHIPVKTRMMILSKTLQRMTMKMILFNSHKQNTISGGLLQSF